MKKNLFILLLGCVVFSQTFAYTSLTSQEVKNYQSGGFIVSDNHSNYEVCNAEKQTNDTKYPSYNRSECFSESGTFKYFICEKNDNCAVVGNDIKENAAEVKVSGDTSVNTSKSTLSAKNKVQLDAFIKKLSSQKDKLSQDAYEKLLSNTLSKYEKLVLKYQKNKQVSDILNYLVEQTKILQLHANQSTPTEDASKTQTQVITQTPITKAQRDAFMEEVKKDLASRITEDKDFVYIDGELAITKAKYNEKDFYHEQSYQQKNNQGQTTQYYIDKNAQSYVCPSGYEFARTREYKTQQWDYFRELDISPLTLETLGYYVNQVANGERKLSLTVSPQQKVNSLYKSEVVDEKYRLTSKLYDGAFLGSGLKRVDVCTQEFGHQWQISTSQAGLDAVKKFTDTVPSYERIWKINSSDMKEKTNNNCFGYSLTGDLKGTTYKQKRWPNEWSESCTEKAYVVCEKNNFPENYSYSHLSFTGFYLLPSGSDAIIQTSFFIAPRETMNKNGINNSYWSAGALQSLDIQLTKAGNGFSNPQSIYTSYAAFAGVNPKEQFSWNVVADQSPVICQKIASTISQTRPGNIENRTKTLFGTLKDITSTGYNGLYFNVGDYALDTNVRRILNSDWWLNPNYKDFIHNYRYKGRMFLLHTYEAMKNGEFNIQKSTPNFDYYIPIWDNGYYFPVSEKK